MAYISRSWELISKKGKWLEFAQENMSKKGNSDGLCNTTVGKYFQKRKVGEFVIEKNVQKRKI